MNRLSNKVAVITGGSSGVGLATAQRFVEEGAVVYVTGRRQQELEAAAAKVGAIAVQGDVSNPADLDRLYDTMRGDGRQNDVLVANAGTSAFAKLEDVTDDMFDNVFNTNVKSTLNTVKKALPLLTDGASIVLVGRRQPGAADVEVVFTRDQVDFVRNGLADIALTCGHEGLEGLEFTELAQERTVALLPLDHFLAAKSAISSADLAVERLFRPDWPEGTLDEIIDQVAMGELIVMVGASATDRIGPAVVAVPVTDVPSTQLVLTWGPGIPAATRDAFVRTAKNVTTKHVCASEIPGSMRSGAVLADKSVAHRALARAVGSPCPRERAASRLVGRVSAHTSGPWTAWRPSSRRRPRVRGCPAPPRWTSPGRSIRPGASRAMPSGR
ncbi:MULTISPECIES: SDR family NAD(P)-dependent oxidoreductase [Streptomyces]|nr:MULTISPECIES: SDR family NAD(P)-dependent oxidoreductase [Streptomyces]MDX3494869.1 SDR family NAD(P)-dependent oxidoreductase [Streptomyces turgidiscabies]GAQ71484.1 cis-2,3-dihydrobiphenyl-2,3-diol dehydrogenase [Streptomyces turgidiscabies]